MYFLTVIIYKFISHAEVPINQYIIFDVVLTAHRRLYVEIKCQLDATEVFIADLIACSTCFGHHYAHHQIFSFGETDESIYIGGAPVQSITGSRGVHFSGRNAGYTMPQGSVKSTGHPLH